MADIRFIPQRPIVRIDLHRADIANVVTQPDVLFKFTDDQLEMIGQAIGNEIERRMRLK